MALPLSTCVSIGPVALPRPEDIPVNTGWLELRIDLLPSDIPRDGEYLLPYLQAFQEKFPNIILTYKSGDSDEQRLETLSYLLNGLSCFLDIDYEESQTYRNQLFRLANAAKALIIYSYHLQSWNGELQLIRSYLDAMWQANPSYAKIVVPAQHLYDTIGLMSLYAEYEHTIIIDSSQHGVRSRLLAPLLGAPFTYAYLHEPTALYQPKASDLQQLLDEYQAFENQIIASSK